jgi:hypothetical protein
LHIDRAGLARVSPEKSAQSLMASAFMDATSILMRVVGWKGAEMVREMTRSILVRMA